MMKLAIVLVALFVAATVAQETISYVSCQDGQCKSDCQTQGFTAGECLDLEGTSNTVRLTCFEGPSMCNDMKIYQDSQCQDTSSMVIANNVCESCQQNFTASCGALHNAMFVAVNCTDSACQNCGGAIIVPFGECKLVAPLGYVMVTAVTQCTVVSFTEYTGPSCTGTNFTQQYESGKCFDGQIFRCN